MFSLNKNKNSLNKEWEGFVKKVHLQTEIYSKLGNSDLQLESFNLKQEVATSEIELQAAKIKAFAIFKETLKRIKGIELYDVQLYGSLALCDGMIAEMKTGEGKTFTAGLSAYVMSILGRKINIITTNDYLASRDLEQLRPIYQFLGISTGLVINSFSVAERSISYQSDIVYTTNKEVGFDYLKDNLKKRPKELILPEFDVAIIDEADSILIDEANTPLVISGESFETIENMRDLYFFLEGISEENFEIDYQKKRISLSDDVINIIEEFIMDWEFFMPKDLYDPNNNALLHMIYQCLKAKYFFNIDKEYIVRDENILIVDKNTGRISPDKKYSNSLHQVLEIKEGLEPSPEQISLASISYQNLFKVYNKISGMSGTAVSQSEELEAVYGIKAVPIPTNKPVIRKDAPDKIYGTLEDKEDALIDEIRVKYKNQQPVLVGTPDIYVSERLSRKLHELNIPNVLLNAKNPDKEADIISQAGTLGSVTIATNIAGRGTDIILGGNYKSIFNMLEDDNEHDLQKMAVSASKEKDKVKELGGLCVLGWTRNESSRIDEQLIGRAGRQGDPGESQFFLSLDDEIFYYIDQNTRNSLEKSIESQGFVEANRKIEKSILNAQSVLENEYSSQRQELLKYDNVIEAQRKILYQNRMHILKTSDIIDVAKEIMRSAITETLSPYIPKNVPNYQWRDEQVREICYINWNILPAETDLILEKDISSEEAIDEIFNLIWNNVQQRTWGVKDEFKNISVYKEIILSIIDEYWSAHIRLMETLRMSIQLSVYASINPLQEYQKTSFHLYHVMLKKMKFEISRNLVAL